MVVLPMLFEHQVKTILVDDREIVLCTDCVLRPERAGAVLRQTACEVDGRRHPPLRSPRLMERPIGRILDHQSLEREIDGAGVLREER